MTILTLALVLSAEPSTAAAQGTNGGQGQVWRLEELHEGFCVQFLVEPAALARKLPRGAVPLPAGRMADLPPALGSVVGEQPEYAGWTPSQLCLFYFRGIEAQDRRVRQEDRRRSPLLGFWTVAATDSLSRARRDVALEVLTNSGGLERSARDAGLNVRRMRSSVGPRPAEEEGVASGADRYELRVGKTQLTWDGYPAADSTPPEKPVTLEWRAEGRRGGWVPGRLTLAAHWTRALVGSLKVEGKDELARLLKASPIRFVGPAYYGGPGSMTFGR